MTHNDGTPGSKEHLPEFASLTPTRSASLIVRNRDGNVALFHNVREDDDFADSASALFTLVREAARQTPGPRYLFLSIDGHRNPAGGFDADALELQANFIPDFLGPYLTAISVPLLSEGAGVYMKCSAEQCDDVPDSFEIEN